MYQTFTVNVAIRILALGYATTILMACEVQKNLSTDSQGATQTASTTESALSSGTTSENPTSSEGCQSEAGVSIPLVQSAWMKQSGESLKVFFSTQPDSDALCPLKLPPHSCEGANPSLLGYTLTILPTAQQVGTFSLANGEVELVSDVMADWGNGCESSWASFSEGEIEILTISNDCIAGAIRLVQPIMSGSEDNDPNGSFTVQACP